MTSIIAQFRSDARTTVWATTFRDDAPATFPYLRPGDEELSGEYRLSGAEWNSHAERWELIYTRAAIDSMLPLQEGVEQRARELWTEALIADGYTKETAETSCGALTPTPAALCAVKAALSSLPSTVREEDWQPIETAPKDGTYIHVARDMGCGFGLVTGVAFWTDTLGGGWIAKGTGSFGELGLAEPALWHPFPDPPAIRALKGKPTPVEGEGQQ